MGWRSKRQDFYFQTPGLFTWQNFAESLTYVTRYSITGREVFSQTGGQYNGEDERRSLSDIPLIRAEVTYRAPLTTGSSRGDRPDDTTTDSCAGMSERHHYIAQSPNPPTAASGRQVDCLSSSSFSHITFISSHRSRHMKHASGLFGFRATVTWSNLLENQRLVISCMWIKGTYQDSFIYMCL